MRRLCLCVLVVIGLLVLALLLDQPNGYGHQPVALAGAVR